jgi:hypothetical protein
MPGYPTRKLLLGGPETLTQAGAELAMVVMGVEEDEVVSVAAAEC